MISKFGFEWTQESLDIVQAALNNQESILISGFAGSGKTTLIEELLDVLPSDSRVVTVDIDTKNKDVVMTSSSIQELDYDNEKLRAYIKDALKLKPNRIVFDECRSPKDAEILNDLIIAKHSVLTSIHATSPRDAVHRFNVLTENLHSKELYAGKLFGVVIHLERTRSNDFSIYTATAHKVKDFENFFNN